MLGTGRNPDDLVGALLDRFQATWEDDGGLSLELRTWRGLHAFLRHITSGVDPVPGMERLTLLGVDRDDTMDLLHLLFSIPVGPYSANWRLLAFVRDIPSEGIP